MSMPRGLLISLFILCLNHTSSMADELLNSFQSPPDSARPWVYWFIMDGNFSREGITADLEAMKAAGLGGLIFMEVNVGIPRGTVNFMSEEWQALFKHAIEEAERLGLEITLNAGPGWTGSGGPWVKVEQSMQHLVSSSVETTGPTHFDSVLPKPEPRAPYFGETDQPQNMLKARQDFYEDVAVLAYPKYNGPLLKDVDEKALYVRGAYSSVPGIKPFLTAPAVEQTAGKSESIPSEKVINLTDHLQADGRLVWDAPEGEWTILRFGRRTTGSNTRPAPEPGIGFECDKFDRAALDAHFESFLGALMKAIGPRPANRTAGWNMLHIDSWEMGAQNWTRGFEKEFARRRRYDLLPYLPVLTGVVVSNPEISERFLWDLRQTAKELIIENHAEHLRQLAHQNGFGLSIEPYDLNPSSDMTLGGCADVPMCEFWSRGVGFDTDFSCYESASIAHTLGRPIVAAEAFTALPEEARKQYPASMKNQGDWALCAGINRFVIHRYAHQPWLDKRPGMTMGPYGVHWERTQTWWPMVAAYHRYLSRCQHLLRQGAPVADICYLVPEGSPHVFRPPASALIGEIPDMREYHFDGCAPETLLSQAYVEDGCVAFPGGAKYRLLALPSFNTMTPQLLRKVIELIAAGAAVVGEPPSKSPSLSRYPECDNEVQQLASEVWGVPDGNKGVIERQHGAGKVYWGGALSCPVKGLDSANPSQTEIYPAYEATADLLKQLVLPPDLETSAPIRYVHRHLPDADIYFVANRASETTDADCLFRIQGRRPELWDPSNGETRDLPEFLEKDGRTSVPLHFEPFQSYFIVFRKPSGKADMAMAGAKNFPALKEEMTIGGPWELLFEDNSDPFRLIRMETLEDWSQRPETEIRHYSGIARYRAQFDLPESATGSGTGRLLIDLGEVHNLARAHLNGEELGVAWCAPWRVDITKAAKPSGNKLEIEVANLWVNRLIGDKALPAEQQVGWTTWNPYQADSPLLKSGLLGPLRILSDRQK